MILELKIIYLIPHYTKHNNNVILINQLLAYKYDFIYDNGNNLQILGTQQNTRKILYSIDNVSFRLMFVISHDK